LKALSDNDAARSSAAEQLLLNALTGDSYAMEGIVHTILDHLQHTIPTHMTSTVLSILQR
jgi:hypothetical protein